MDELTLKALEEEMNADCSVMAEALALVETRLAEKTDSGLEGAAHHLVRLYNVVEQMGLRVAKTFENRLDDDKGWHAELLRRLSIPIKGVRPELFPREAGQPLRELRGFRHVFTHAYDLQLDRDKIELLQKYARQVVPALRTATQQFIRSVARQEGLEL